jgi:hypothetical protein
MPGEMEPDPRDANGAYIAAFLAATFGLLVLALVHIGCEMSDSFKANVFAIGKAWIPGAQGIGPYSGKETLMVVAWLGSWLPLHYLLRAKMLRLRPWFGVALAMLFAATLLLWPPVWHWIEGS